MRYDDALYRLERRVGDLLVIDGGPGSAVGAYATATDKALIIKLSPGCQTYYDAREYHGRPVTDADLVAAVIVVALGGHPDADEDRAGTEPSVVWGHRLAIVLGEDPRQVSTTYAPTETRKISRRIQRMAAMGVEVVRIDRGIDSNS